MMLIKKFTFSTSTPLRLPSFSHFPLYPKILQALSASEIHTPTYIQYALLSKIFSSPSQQKYHIISPTGSGKTLAYMVPMVHGLKKAEQKAGERLTKQSRPRGLIITSNKQLVLQTKNVGKMLSHFCKVKCEGIGIGRSLFDEKKEVKNGVDILVSNYTRLSRMYQRNQVYLSYLEWIVVDEVDTLFESNGKIIEDLIQTIIQPRQHKQNMKIIFSSTTNPQNLKTFLGDRFPGIVQLMDKQAHVNLQNIKHEFLHCPQLDKHKPVLNLLYRQRDTKTMIFCNTVKSLHELQYFLFEQGFKVITLHSQLNKQMRLKNYQMFRDQDKGILLSTDLGARGVHFPNLKRIINYDFPLTTCDYLQRAGRTGRAGSSGNVISLYFQKDMNIINELKGASFKDPLKIKNSAYGYRNREEIGKSKYK